jgi:hypothetical protein
MLCSGFLFGTTFITAANVAEAWLDDSNSTTVYAMTGFDQGMFNSHAAISAKTRSRSHARAKSV